jgi:hypothetical protein
MAHKSKPSDGTGGPGTKGCGGNLIMKSSIQDEYARACVEAQEAEKGSGVEKLAGDVQSFLKGFRAVRTSMGEKDPR